jgi:hypothetical protein
MPGSRADVAREASPDGGWTLEIHGPSKAASSLYAVFRQGSTRYMGVPFGYATDPSRIRIRWDYPDKVCGIAIGSECYLLFRWGARRRRRRERVRLGEGRAFTQDEISWFCNKDHSGRQSGEVRSAVVGVARSGW